MRVVYETLRQLNVENKPVITVFNKQDKLSEKRTFTDPEADYVILTSAKTGQGMEELKQKLEKLLRKNQIYVERVYPYSQAGILQLIRKQGNYWKKNTRRMELPCGRMFRKRSTEKCERTTYCLIKEKEL